MDWNPVRSAAWDCGQTLRADRRWGHQQTAEVNSCIWWIMNLPAAGLPAPEGSGRAGASTAAARPARGVCRSATRRGLSMPTGPGGGGQGELWDGQATRSGRHAPDRTQLLAVVEPAAVAHGGGGAHPPVGVRRIRPCRSEVRILAAASFTSIPPATAEPSRKVVTGAAGRWTLCVVRCAWPRGPRPGWMATPVGR